jgi:hypothetical protein
VWTAIGALVWIGRVISPVLARDQERFELKLDLGEDGLFASSLMSSFSGLPVEAVDRRRIVIRPPGDERKAVPRVCQRCDLP